MQHGAPLPAIVQSMEGLSAYRGDYATGAKKAAQRKHRHRVKSNLKQVAREAMDVEDFDEAPGKEAMNAWDLW